MPVSHHRSLVLVVDDDPAGREILETVLGSGPYDVVSASDGCQALEMATSLRPDLILLDVMMPDLPGFEVCRMLRNQPDLGPVPIIMITALEDRESRLRGLRSGADDFVSKPFDRAELLARVHTITELNRYRRMEVEAARFRWVVENADDGYAMLDENGAVIVANAAARNMLDNGTETDITGLRFHDLVEAIYTRVPNDPRAPDNAGGSTAGEREYLMRPASACSAPRWLELRQFAPDARSGECLVCLRDVSVEMATNRRITEFHSLLAGRLRSPLFGLVTIPEWLLSVGPAIAESDREQFMRVILKHGQLLRREIDRILHYLSSPEFSRAGGGMSLTEFRDLVTEMAAEFDLSPIPVSGVESADFSLGVSRKVMDLVLRELCSNSIRFHPARSPRVEVFIDRPQHDRVVLRVENDGASSPPEFLARAWTPYTRASASGPEEDPGMGLGLSMVATLLLEAGGRCRMLNRAGGGVVFELDLPVAVGATGKVVKLAIPGRGLES